MLQKAKWVIIPLFFIGYLYLGLSIYRDYGTHYDEEAQMAIGEHNYNYVFSGNKTLLDFEDRYYGAIFEVILHAVTLGMLRTEQIFTRHLGVFLSFYLGVVFFYFLAKKITNNWFLGLMACLLLVMHPRIFADSFYNSKDIPFLTFFIIASFSLLYFIESPSFLNATLHALTSAVLVTIRLGGGIVPVLTIGFGLFSQGFIKLRGFNNLPSFRNMLKFKPLKNFTHNRIIILFYYLILCAVLVILFSPILWHNPLSEFFNALQRMSNYPWGGKVLYRGEFITATALPWHYIPTWILITTPIGYLIFTILGLITVVWELFHPVDGKARSLQWQDVYILMWFFLPITIGLLLHSTFYDGWRHMFFVYPAMVLIMLRGIQKMINLEFFRDRRFLAYTFVSFLVIIALFQPLRFMLRNHPFENVYFNRLAGEKMNEIKARYDMDYWGLSYLPGLRYILKSDKSDVIKLYILNTPGRMNAYLLYPNQRKRLLYVDDIKQADYFITNYRWHPQPYTEFTQEVFSVKVENASILSVFRLH